VAAALVVAVLPLSMPWRDAWRDHRWTLAVGAGLVGLGWWLRVSVPGHEAMRAHSFAEFWTAFHHHLQWPLVRQPVFGAISFLPWAWLTFRCIRHRNTIRPVDRVGFALGLWALVHYAAMAFMRGSLQPWPPVRGLDNVVVGLAVNAFILLEAATRVPWRERRMWPAIVAGCVWGGAGFYGVADIVRENVQIVLPARRARVQLSEESTRAYLATGDPAWLRANEIPYPHAAGLRHMLDQPEIRAILPASVRPALAVTGTSEPPEAFRWSGTNTPADRPPTGWVVQSTLAGTGTWTSEPIEATGDAYWLFRLGGEWTSEGAELALRSPGGQKLAGVAPKRAFTLPGGDVVVRAPAIPAVIVARDQRDDVSIAFSGPVEMATGSVLARSLARRGWWFSVAGVAMAIMGWVRFARDHGPAA
jgi:hypothetical protein